MTAAALVAVAVVAGAAMVAAADGAAATVEIAATAVIAAIAGNESFLPQAAARTQPLPTCLFSGSAIALPEPAGGCARATSFVIVTSTGSNFFRSDGFETPSEENLLTGVLCSIVALRGRETSAYRMPPLLSGNGG